MRNVLPKNPKLIPEHAERVFKGKIYDTYQWQQEVFDGSFETYEMLKRADTVKVIAVKDGKIVISSEEQPHVGKFRDMPGGRHDYEHESELEAAKRELVEETGLVCKNWKLLSVTQLHSKIEQFLYIFLAWDVIEEREQTLDAGEKIDIELYEIIELKELVDSGVILRFGTDFLEEIETIDQLLAFPEFR